MASYITQMVFIESEKASYDDTFQLREIFVIKFCITVYQTDNCIFNYGQVIIKCLWSLIGQNFFLLMPSFLFLDQ